MARSAFSRATGVTVLLLFVSFLVVGCTTGVGGLGVDFTGPDGTGVAGTEGAGTGSGQYGTGTAVSVGTTEPIDTADGRSYLSSVLLDGSHLLRFTRSSVTVSVDTTNIPSGWKPEYEQQVLDGLRQWAGASDGSLSFSIVSGAADINLRWVESIPSEAGNITGVTEIARSGSTFFPPTVKLALFAGDSRLSDREMTATAIHEVGHAIGLTGHSPARPDVMYYASTAAGLTASDVATLRDLYGRPADITQSTGSVLGARGVTVIRFYATADGRCHSGCGQH